MNEPDPDQLLRSIDLALAQAKSRRKGGRGDRNAIRAAMLLIFILGVMAAMAVLWYMASQLSDRQPPVKANPSETGVK